MAGYFYKGIVLPQHKEPALSRDLREFFNADTIGAVLNRPPIENLDELTPVQITNLAREAHIIDERDGSALVQKLIRGKRPRILVGDAVDDEPYISSQLNPLLKDSEDAILGLRLAQKAAYAESAQFAVYKNLTDLEVRIPQTLGEFPVLRIRGGYPAEYQASMAFNESDTLVIGVGALIHLARAARFNRPQTTTFVTVAGNCIGNPTNLEVSLGMTVGQVLERCGLIEDPVRVAVGGSMTGYSVIDTDKTLVTPSTRAILAFHEDFKTTNLNCIGCSRCVHVCPEGLNPFYLYKSIREKRFDTFRTLDAHMCIGCGTCSYICPAKLDLTETIQEAAENFRRMNGSIRKNTTLLAKLDQARLESHLKAHDYRRAKAAHKRALRTHEKELLAARGLAEKEKFAAVSAADAALAQAKTALDTTPSAETQNAYDGATKAREAAVSAAAEACEAQCATLEAAALDARTQIDAALEQARLDAKLAALAVLDNEDLFEGREPGWRRQRLAAKAAAAAPPEQPIPDLVVRAMSAVEAAAEELEPPAELLDETAEESALLEEINLLETEPLPDETPEEEDADAVAAAMAASEEAVSEPTHGWRRNDGIPGKGKGGLKK